MCSAEASPFLGAAAQTLGSRSFFELASSGDNFLANLALKINDANKLNRPN